VGFGDSRLVPRGPLGFVPSDPAKRMSDIITTHFLADPSGNRGRWVAIRLSDGGSDGIVYDDVARAAWEQLHYRQCAYIRIPTGGIGPRECDVILAYHRKVYDLGNLPPYLQGVPLRTPQTIDWMTRD
jgi:hypothetical protein